MGAPVWVELVCRRCASTEAGQFVLGAIPRRAMARTARGFGWVYDREIGDWFCGSCKNHPERKDC